MANTFGGFNANTMSDVILKITVDGQEYIVPCNEPSYADGAPVETTAYSAGATRVIGVGKDTTKDVGIIKGTTAANLTNQAVFKAIRNGIDVTASFQDITDVSNPQTRSLQNAILVKPDSDDDFTASPSATINFQFTGSPA